MMSRWYAIILVAAVVGGWIAYPSLYPFLAETARLGRLPAIDWNRLKPGALVSGGTAAERGAEWPRLEKVAITDHRFDAVVIIEGNAKRGTGFIIKRDGVPCIVTSQHALAGNSKLVIRDTAGRGFKGGRMFAARDADVAMIEIEAPEPGLPSLAVAGDVAGMVRPGEEILLAGDAQGTGVIKLSPGKVQAIEPVFVAITNTVYSGLRGAPLYHPDSRSVIGVLAEAPESPLRNRNRGSLVHRSERPAAAGPPSRFFGHRLDTITEWEALDWGDFQEATAAAEQGRNELEMVFHFVSGRRGYGSLRELKAAEEKARMRLANRTLSQRDRQKTVEELLRLARSVVDRRLALLNRMRLSHIHREDLKELGALAEEIRKEIAVAEQDCESFAHRLGLHY